MPDPEAPDVTLAGSRPESTHVGMPGLVSFPQTDLFLFLGVSRTATEEEIEAAYARKQMEAASPPGRPSPTSQARERELRARLDEVQVWLLADPAMRAAYLDGLVCSERHFRDKRQETFRGRVRGALRGGILDPASERMLQDAALELGIPPIDAAAVIDEELRVREGVRVPADPGSTAIESPQSLPDGPGGPQRPPPARSAAAPDRLVEPPRPPSPRPRVPVATPAPVVPTAPVVPAAPVPRVLPPERPAGRPGRKALFVIVSCALAGLIVVLALLIWRGRGAQMTPPASAPVAVVAPAPAPVSVPAPVPAVPPPEPRPEAVRTVVALPPVPSLSPEEAGASTGAASGNGGTAGARGTHVVRGTSDDPDEPWLNLRAGAGLEYPVVAKLPDGTRVDIEERLSRRWVRVVVRSGEWAGKTGYANDRWLGRK